RLRCLATTYSFRPPLQGEDPARSAEVGKYRRTSPPGSLRSPPSPCRGGLFYRLRVDRRAGAAGDDQRRAAEEELVDAVFGTVFGELLEIENLAHAQPHGRDHHPVPWLIGLRGLVRPYLDSPSVGADRGDLLVLTPVAVLELDARRVAAGIAAPLLL